MKLFKLTLDKKKEYINSILNEKYYLIIKIKKDKLLKTGGEAILLFLKKLKLKKICDIQNYSNKLLINKNI